jgi:histidyl-tRNA synthetase
MELAGRSVKGQLKQASRSEARYVAIFGDDGVQLRDREGGEDKVVAPDTVMHHIRGRM